MAQANIRLNSSWKQHLAAEFDQPYMLKLKQFLLEQKTAGKVVYPAGKNIFAAFDAIDFDHVKVIILGQDPYHGEGQAHGLSFSVPDGIKVPPSLVNIYKELQRDLQIAPNSSGNLQRWANQGVLLLNSVLTVEQGLAASHRDKGWETFTDKVIEKLSTEREGLVFMLWGSYAHKKGQAIDGRKHLVLKTTHPSPLSAHRGFLGCGHFSTANDYLRAQGKEAIEW